MTHHSPNRPLLATLALLLSFLLVAAACGSDDSDEGSSTSQADDSTDSTGSTGDEEGDEGGDANSTDADEDTTAPAAGMPNITALAASEETPCGFEELIPLPETPVCHTVTVPEDWANPDETDQVVLHVAVFEGDGTDPDPLIYLDGGPGGHTLDVLSFTYEDLVAPHIGGRDVVVYDQRGLGTSEPLLRCDEAREVTLADLRGELNDDAAESISIDALDSCQDRLTRAGVNLEAYNSISSAHDLEAIRITLGYDQVNAFGISYGTRLGQTYLRLYPNSLRSITLDSVVPNEAALWEGITASAERSLDLLFEGCAEDAGCAEAYPNFKADYFALLDELESTPVTLDVQNNLTGEELTVVVDADLLTGLVFNALYSQELFAEVPRMVDNVKNGSYAELELLVTLQLINMNFFSLGMQLSVECNEEVPFDSADALAANDPTEPGYQYLTALNEPLSIFETCEHWPSGTAPAVENEPVISDVPALVLAGNYDPITPPAYAEQVANNLASSSFFTLPYEGHGIAVTDCGAMLLESFLADPSAPVDGRCVLAAPSPRWVPGEVGAITMVPFEASDPAPVTGLRPEGWTEQGFGSFARSSTASDQTALVIQVVTGLPTEALLGQLNQSLGAELTSTDPVKIDGVTWTAYEGALDDGTIMRLLLSEGDETILALLAAVPEEIEELTETVLLPAAVAATPA